MMALEGLRVLDLSRVLAGPWATQILADLGADVVKVERPGAGDDTRSWGPPFLKDRDGRATTVSAYYLCANRNKRSVAIDLSHPEGAQLVRRMADKADVLVENFKAGSLAQYGLDYATLTTSAPRLVYCSITGFGQTGPYASRPGYDFLIQALGGLMSISGHPDGSPGEGPMKTGVAVTDILTGLYATIGIQAALAARERTGRGQWIDMALLDVQVACLANQAMNYLTTGRLPGRLGNAHPNVVPYQDFPTQDGRMILAIGNDGQFRRFCRVAGIEPAASDPRFATNASRVDNRDALLGILRQATSLRPTSEWVSLLEAEGVPCGPINDLAAVFADPQVIARKLRLSMAHPSGEAPTVASPIRLSETPVTYRSAPPELGADARSALADWLGIDAKEVERLRASGVL